MADRKITDLTALAAGSQATGDLLTIVDVSEAAATDKNKKITVESLFKGIPGNVGVGETSPLGNLHVKSGDSGASSVGSAADELVLENSTDSGMTFLSGTTGFASINFADSGDANVGQILYSHGSNYLAIKTNDSERMRIDSSGNLGIGTSSPATLLHIAEATDTELRIEATGSSAGDDARLVLKTTNGSFTVQNDRSLGTSGALTFAGNTANNIVIDHNTGNVGIGTSSPGSKLTVNGDIFASGGNIYTGANQQLSSDSSIRPLIFGIGGTEKARIDSSGNVGIGETNNGSYWSGANRLVVRNSGNAGATIVSGTGGLGTLAFTDTQSVTNEGYVLYDHSVNALKFGTLNTERMQITSSGTVLLNGQTSNPTGAATSLYTNSASGSAEGITIKSDSTSGNRFMIGFYNNANSKVGDIVYNGTSTAYNTTSDYRLKENVVAVTDGITRIKQLNPSRFNFIGNTETTVDGFLAHEVQSVVPEAVTGTHNQVDDDNNPVYQGIDQSKLVPLLTAALQEAIAKIETLETSNADLLARVTALEAS